MRIDAETLDMRAIEVKTNAIDDAAALVDLLAQIPEGEKISSVGGDYDTGTCHAAIAERGAAVVIPMRRNGRGQSPIVSHERMKGLASRLTMKLFTPQNDWAAPSGRGVS